KIESGEKKLFMEDFVRLYKLYNNLPNIFVPYSLNKT
ncbi:hypothetical protein LEP1GSC116_4608, partial [Leptospira interrogans serovar Icterohaemorrhagiae str. Verdun HP]